jgi:hypothetical protein
MMAHQRDHCLRVGNGAVSQHKHLAIAAHRNGSVKDGLEREH